MAQNDLELVSIASFPPVHYGILQSCNNGTYPPLVLSLHSPLSRQYLAGCGVSSSLYGGARNTTPPTQRPRLRRFQSECFHNKGDTANLASAPYTCISMLHAYFGGSGGGHWRWALARWRLVVCGRAGSVVYHVCKVVCTLILTCISGFHFLKNIGYVALLVIVHTSSTYTHTHTHVYLTYHERTFHTARRKIRTQSATCTPIVSVPALSFSLSHRHLLTRPARATK